MLRIGGEEPLSLFLCEADGGSRACFSSAAFLLFLGFLRKEYVR